jgi:hypothetical protein
MIPSASHASRRVLLFTGHLIDAPGRTDPRFPPELEAAASGAITSEIAKIAPSIGIASAARGGDILFHEACRARGIQTTIVLPFPIAEFEKRSVSGLADSRWEKRFHALLSSAGASQIVEVDTSNSSNVFRACNKAMLDLARASDPTPTLLALWDRQIGDGPGGTAEMVIAVEQLGGRVVVIELSSLSRSL